MDSKATLKIKSRLQNIIKRKTNRISDKIVNESQVKTPRFIEEVKLPSLSPVRSIKSLGKPYPIAKVTLNPMLKESASLMIIPRANAQIPLGKLRNHESLSNRLKNVSSFERVSNTHSPELINKSLFIQNTGYKVNIKNQRLEPISHSPQPSSLL